MKSDWQIILLAIVCFVLGTSEYVIVGVLDKIASSADITIAQAGQLITVFAFTVSLGTPIVIYFISRFNQNKILILSLVLVSLSCLLMIASSSYVTLLLSRVVMAIGVGVFNVLCFVVATKVAKPEKKGSAVATVSLGFNVALILGLPLGRLITSLLGWKTIFVFTGILSLISVVAIYKLIPALEGEPPTPFNDQLKLIKKSTIILSLLTSFFWIIGYSHLYSYITPYLQHTSAMDDHMLSVTFLVFGIATVAGNKTGGFLGDKIGVSKTIFVSLLSNVIALVLLSLVSSSIYASIAMLAIWGVAAWIPGPLFRYSVISLAPESPSVILSLYNSIIQFGIAIGAGLGGLEIERISPVTLSWTSAGIVFVSFTFSFLFARKNVRQANTASAI
jgi:DHA1 family putative efflux transporter-like MFS transporter